MLGRVDKADTVAGVSEKGFTRLYAVQDADARLALDAQTSFVKVAFTVLVDQAHQRLGLMSVELVDDEDPLRLRIGLERLFGVRGKVCFGAGWADGGSHDLSCGDLEVGDQGLGAVTRTLELPALYPSGSHRQAGVFTLQSLDAGFLVCA